MSYAIRFDFPERKDSLWAGWHKDAYGYAPTLASASIFKAKEEAEGVLTTAYGTETASYGTVVKTAKPVRR